MGKSQYLMDTNAVIDYLGNNIPAMGMGFLNEVMDTKPQVSVITKIEVLGFNAPATHYRLLTQFMSDVIVLNLTDKIVETCIDIRKKCHIKLPDAIIAATALAYDLVLITRNISDFKNIPGLRFINPHG
ncbi:MAG: type II toxin-antitoxin system VapC family toxin [Prevotellaceae bacterium]|jgi:predicted nucleic acid-binding protein|nr:type II toxin-antitoxin system VapC family toxin [Prevotellaceae bacterium]